MRLISFYKKQRILTQAVLDKKAYLGVGLHEECFFPVLLRQSSEMISWAQRRKSALLYLQLMRLHRPIGIWLVLWPCFWGAMIVYQGNPPLQVMLLLLIGATIVRSAGCILNDIADHKFDRQVLRTQTRPLASGALTLYDAWALLAFLLALATLVAKALNPILILWGAAALIPIAIYPLMKRITWWPQAFLGLTFNLGVFFVWGSAHHSPDLVALLLYLAALCWTLGYDTIYGHQDKKDDAAIGVKSTALRFNKTPKSFIGFWYVGMVCCLYAVGLLAGYGVVFFSGIALCAMHLLWQVRSLNPDNPASCLSIFKSNQWLGGMVFLSIAAEILL